MDLWVPRSHVLCTVAVTQSLQVAYPKIVFSGLILYSVVDRSLWRTAGLELLLGAFVLGGSLVGAMLCRHFSWHRIVSSILASWVLWLWS